jgi:beta-lactamase superfamily II metal-dependent hydrolase
MDHLSGLNELLKKRFVKKVWDTNNNKMFDSWPENSPYREEDWETYRQIRDEEIDMERHILYQNETEGMFSNNDGIRVLFPTEEYVDFANDTKEYHHLSYVLQFEHAGVKVLFGGDASIQAWHEIYQTIGKKDLRSDIFLAPHHGSKTNITHDVFKYIKPLDVIVSVNRTVDYDLDYYNQIARKKVWSTKHYGNIIITIDDDGGYNIDVEKNA